MELDHFDDADIACDFTSTNFTYLPLRTGRASKIVAPIVLFTVHKERQSCSNTLYILENAFSVFLEDYKSLGFIWYSNFTL